MLPHAAIMNIEVLVEGLLFVCLWAGIYIGLVKRRRRPRSQFPSVSDQWLLHYRETEHL